MASDRVPVTITYRKSGSQPPFFVAGSFSDPAWEPQEMEYSTDDEGGYVFKKQVLAAEGASIQYKFRAAAGEWALDEDAPTVTDEMGNRNNTMEIVRPEKLVHNTIASLSSAHTSRTTPGGAQEGHAAHNEPESTQADTDTDHLSKPLPKSVLEVLKQESPVPRSQTSTPGFARTAAEVADSAALLDKDDAELEIPDDEAGRLGVRRLTATPIPEVASTAAEVADSAKLLDVDEDGAMEVPPPLFAHERMSDSYDAGPAAPEEDHEGAPLFAYELVGSGKNDVAPSDDGRAAEHEPSGGQEYDLDSYDLNDPTLERLPTSLEGIYDTVRKVESSLNEDRVDFEAFPPSPVVGPGRRSSNDFAVDLLSTSPNASPVFPRAVRRLEIPGVPQGPETPERSASQLSLHSIIEEETGLEEGFEDSLSVTRADPTSEPETESKAPPSDDDDGIQLKSSKATPKNGQASPSGYLTPERAASPVPPDTPAEPTPNVSVPIPVVGPKDEDIAESLEKDAVTTIVPEDSEAESPRIVVHRAQSTDKGGEASSVPMPGSGSSLDDLETDANASSTSLTAPAAEGQEPVLTETQSTDDTPTGTLGPKETEPRTEEEGRLPGSTDDPSGASNMARSTGVETRSKSSEATEVSRRKGASPAERAATPSSIRSTGLEASKNGNWLTAFFKLVFVDWIGGFLHRFLGGGKA